jgi:hypothetical protein
MPPEPNPGVTFTDELIPKIYQTVGAIEAKLDGIDRQYAAMDGRVRSVEGQLAKLGGVFAVLLFPVTLITTWVGKKVSRLW